MRVLRRVIAARVLVRERLIELAAVQAAVVHVRQEFDALVQILLAVTVLIQHICEYPYKTWVNFGKARRSAKSSQPREE